MSSKKLQVQEEITPNLIPMIDIMFLLLLFFMLGADMGQRELEEVILPLAYAVKEDKEEDQVGEENVKLVVNVHHDSKGCQVHEDSLKNLSDEDAFKNSEICRNKTHWRIGIRGKDCTDLKKLEVTLKQEGDRGRPGGPLKALSSGQQVTPSERTVLVRGDAAAPYGQIQEVINTCAKVGIYKIECGAARPPDADSKSVQLKSP
ncbi:MAG TPA: biopolymer transporter ExbD [Planctomycetota bacterium]|nr:biopolymer transporter ExbD [Planctomycetota bacterium]